jgi:hypothetical protein
MRTVRPLCVAFCFPVLIGAQRPEPPLSYHGWALGISLDSAATLTKSLIGAPLVCVGMDTATMFCQTDSGPGYASLYFTPMPRRLEEMSLQIPLDRRASKDSLKNWFTTRWGPPIPRELLGKRSTSTGPVPFTTEVIGTWARGEMIFGMAAIASIDTTRTLAISIQNLERQVRLMLQRADTSRRRE